MASFMIRFLFCNIFISGIVLILLITKRIFRNNLTSRMQYNLWFLFLGLLAVPFIPIHPHGLPSLFSWFKILRTPSTLNSGTNLKNAPLLSASTAENWMNDFTLSVNQGTPSVAGIILFGIWVIGMLAMIILVAKSLCRLNALKKSSLPLQNKEIKRLFQDCLNEMSIIRPIPVYSTAFLKSPVIVGLFKPCIYLPLHLISDYTETDLRYMLFHELQHYKHKDALTNYFMNLAGIIYWFNPLVWYALKEMRTDREVACDTSVLQMLDEKHYEDYGNTLINFAEKISLTPFPFASGLGGNMKQMKRRILNISSYEKPSFWHLIRSFAAFGITTSILISFVPLVSTYAADGNHYQWDASTEDITYTDLSSYFGNYNGSFVLYNMSENSWNIYNEENATMRVSPDSTYKIYTALFGLENGIITPENSFRKWNGKNYPFDAWNVNQTLQSAMDSSVNWYFESIDKQLGASTINSYLQQIGYGNENISGDFSSYWMQSSLKISPVEQVELLKDLYRNNFNFTPANIHAVKNSIHLTTSENGDFYGKTGTGRVNGQDINGWFIGFIESQNNTYFFSTNIQSEQRATGSKASDIALSILSDLNIWK